MYVFNNKLQEIFFHLMIRIVTALMNIAIINASVVHIRLLKFHGEWLFKLHWGNKCKNNNVPLRCAPRKLIYFECN